MALADEPSGLRPGTPVEVHDRFEGRWARGFEVAEEVEGGGYRVRRLSDGEVLPVTMREDEVRKERRRETWWF